MDVIVLIMCNILPVMKSQPFPGVQGAFMHEVAITPAQMSRPLKTNYSFAHSSALTVQVHPRLSLTQPGLAGLSWLEISLSAWQR